MIYPRGRSLAGIILGDGVVEFQPAIIVPKFTDGLRAGLELPNPQKAMRDQRIQLAAKLYVGSYFEKSVEAQFMGLMSVLEVLKDQESSPNQTVEMVDRWLGEVRLSQTPDKESLKSRLEFLKVQSIGQGIKALVERHLPGQGKAARSLYDRRSKLVHHGGMNDDIAATLREAEGLVRLLFVKILIAGAALLVYVWAIERVLTGARRCCA